MANQKVTELVENVTVAVGDLLYLIDDPGGEPASQKATVLNAVKGARLARELIAELTPTGASASFTGIPATYRNLYLEWVARTDRVATNEPLAIYFNNDTTATNYHAQQLRSSDATASATETDTAQVAYATAVTAPSGSAGTGWLKIMNYAGTTFFKTANGVTAFRTVTGTDQVYLVNLEWESALAINRLDVVTINASNFIAGSTFRLYGEY